MAKVTDLDRKRRERDEEAMAKEAGGWIGGIIRCLECGHEWEGRAPAGTMEWECPQCHTFKGVMKGFAVPSPRIQCNCGNDLFFLCESGATCACCGAIIDPDEFV